MASSKNGHGRGRGLVAEIIGRVAAPLVKVIPPSIKSFDASRPDYKFWAHLRRGKQPGYELGGLFAKRICEIDSEWTLGRGFTVKTGVEALDERAAQFVRKSLNVMMTWRKDANAHGDAYLIVNADGSVSMAPADTVDVVTDELDYTRVVAYRITTRTDRYTVEDEYRADGRTVTIKRHTIPWVLTLLGRGRETAPLGPDEQRFEFPNPLGKIPVIHLANDREANEIYGHPIVEGLLKLFQRYDDSVNKTLDVVEIAGQPVPVAEGLEEPQQAMELNKTGTETYVDKDGNSQTIPVVDFSILDMLWLGKGASFKFAQPTPGYTADVVAMLKKLFYLMLEHIGIPEWAWGGAIASSKASVDAQLPAFIRYLEGRRVQLEEALLSLVVIWLLTVRLFEFIPAVDEETVSVEWPDLVAEDEALKFKWVEWADRTGKLTEETALRQADLVEDPAAEIEKARKEAEQRQAEFDRRVEQDVADAEREDEEEEEERVAA